LRISAETQISSLNFARRKLLGVILAICADTPIIAIDEVFVGLDSEFAERMKNLIQFAANNLNRCLIVSSFEQNQLKAIDLDMLVNLSQPQG
jgi:ABC-type multidrug transport system ATPase subunit